MSAGIRASVYTVGFGRDSRTLVSGGEDGVCYLWDLRPPGSRPDNDPARLWQDLAGEDGSAAYQAIWALSEMPDRAVALLAEKLRPVKSVIDLDHVDRRELRRGDPEAATDENAAGSERPEDRVGGRRQAGHFGAGPARHCRCHRVTQRPGETGSEERYGAIRHRRAGTIRNPQETIKQTLLVDHLDVTTGLSPWFGRGSSSLARECDPSSPSDQADARGWWAAPVRTMHSRAWSRASVLPGVVVFREEFHTRGCRIRSDPVPV